MQKEGVIFTWVLLFFSQVVIHKPHPTVDLDLKKIMERT